MLSRPRCGGQSPAVRPPDAGGIRFVDDDECFMPIVKCDEALHRCAVAIHAVETSDRDPDAPHAAFGAPARDRILDSV